MDAEATGADAVLSGPCTWEECDLCEKILCGLREYGVHVPSLVQRCFLPAMLSGKNVTVQGKSGLGKSTACEITALQKVCSAVASGSPCGQPQVLLLTYKRERAIGIRHRLLSVGQFVVPKICVHLAVQGDNGGSEPATAQIVVGVPGRVLALVKSGVLRVQDVKLLVLDSAEVLFERGLVDSVLSLLRQLRECATDLQVLVGCDHSLAPRELELLSKRCFRGGSADVQFLLKSAEPCMAAIDVHHFYHVEEETRKLAFLCDLWERLTVLRSIIYCNTRRKVDWLAENLRQQGFPVSVLHGELSSEEQYRAVQSFCNSGVEARQLLIANEPLCSYCRSTTDNTEDWDMEKPPVLVGARCARVTLCARRRVSEGVDAVDSLLVIHYDLPVDVESYSWRLGHWGSSGRRKRVAVNFVTPDDVHRVLDIETRHQIQIRELPMDTVNLISDLLAL